MTGQRYFAFVRAINTGARRLTNAELVAPLVAAGLDDVAAYQAAGNLTFRGDAASADPRRLDLLLTEAYGFETRTFVRTLDELRTIAGTDPFTPEDLAGTDGRVQVTFLERPPDRGALEAARALVPDDDRVVFAGAEWFWLPVRGISDSRLPVAAIERTIGPMTMRTHGTVRRMLRAFDS